MQDTKYILLVLVTMALFVTVKADPKYYFVGHGHPYDPHTDGEIANGNYHYSKEQCEKWCTDRYNEEYPCVAYTHYSKTPNNEDGYCRIFDAWAPLD